MSIIVECRYGSVFIASESDPVKQIEIKDQSFDFTEGFRLSEAVYEDNSNESRKSVEIVGINTVPDNDYIIYYGGKSHKFSIIYPQFNDTFEEQLSNFNKLYDRDIFNKQFVAVINDPWDHNESFSELVIQFDSLDFLSGFLTCASWVGRSERYYGYDNFSREIRILGLFDVKNQKGYRPIINYEEISSTLYRSVEPLIRMLIFSATDILSDIIGIVMEYCTSTCDSYCAVINSDDKFVGDHDNSDGLPDDNFTEDLDEDFKLSEFEQNNFITSMHQTRILMQPFNEPPMTPQPPMFSQPPIWPHPLIEYHPPMTPQPPMFGQPPIWPQPIIEYHLGQSSSKNIDHLFEKCIKPKNQSCQLLKTKNGRGLSYMSCYSVMKCNTEIESDDNTNIKILRYKPDKRCPFCKFEYTSRPFICRVSISQK